MDILKLRCFSVLSECLSFSAAAYELNISQSSLSKHIIGLEKELSVPLFDRRGRKTSLTEQGEALVEYAQNILDEYDRMMQRTNEFKAAAVKTLSFGIAPMGCQYFWLQRLNNAVSELPARKISIIEREEIDLVTLAARGELEFLIIRKEILPAKGFRTYTLFVENAVVILPDAHPLAYKKNLRLKELKNEKFIFMGEFTAPHKVFKTACNNAGFEPNILRMIRSDAAKLDYVHANEGICLYFESDTDFFRNMNGIHIIPLESDIKSEIVLAVPASKKPGAAEKFLAERLGTIDSIISAN